MSDRPRETDPSDTDRADGPDELAEYGADADPDSDPGGGTDDGTEYGADEVVDYDADALVGRLKRNALASLGGLAIIVAIGWREPMAVVGLLLGGGVVLVNFMFLERLVSRILEGRKKAPSPLQIVVLAFRVVLLGLLLYGIFALPGIRPIPVALGLSVLVLAVVIESLSGLFSASPPRA